MNPPLHLLGLAPANSNPRAPMVRIVTRADAPGAVPLFRAPVFPTPYQLNREVPFTANLPLPRTPRAA